MSKKVVHVLGAMNAGGVEAWLMTLLRNTDKGLINHEFIVHHKEKAFYDDEIYSLGSQIHYCQYSANPFVYALNLFRAFKKINPDIVHSHVHAFSGLVLLVAYLCGIKNRISHCHSDTRLKEKNNSFIRKCYFSFMKFLISMFATTRIAVSSLAAENLYGIKWKTKKNCVVIPCGIDISKYDPKYKNVNMRKDFGLPDNAFVIGHVGRFEEPKNHRFLIDMFFELRKTNQKAYLVLVGDGTLKAEIEKKVEDLDLTPYVIFTGLRKDVPVIMLSVFDVFVFPSLWEGLGLVAVEAQAANLLSIVSENVPVEVNCGNCIHIKLSIEEWVENISKVKNPNIEVDFSIYDNVLFFNKIYSMDF
ncbi:glycosyltransferase [Acinetobacter sp. 10FS3-1]|uniref:glycosyltransferase n=1 Tax=Acinetobacter sp. 10FS3-1 TaxID=2563897 RepID=UPI00157D6F8E|nr:glycosyltransferase [Acinetobacter sp. 10FS3-1]QKQ71177.1 glycosyltransferase family 1 protein [Acinetobacter sp. 10FS3-1]